MPTMSDAFQALGPLAQFIAIVAALVGGVIATIKISMRVGALELKVDTMWGFQMRRSMSEVITSGIAQMNSPLKFSEEAVARLEPIKDDLLAWYTKQPQGLGDATLMLKIEQSFGDILLKLICIPCGLSYGACLILALFMAKGVDELELGIGHDRT